MTRNRREININQATLMIDGTLIAVSNLVIDKLNSVQNLKPLMGENPAHQMRYEIHAFLEKMPASDLAGREFPRIEVTDQKTGEKHVLSQVNIGYCRDGELKMLATFFK